MQEYFRFGEHDNVRTAFKARYAAAKSAGRRRASALRASRPAWSRPNQRRELRSDRAVIRAAVSGARLKRGRSLATGLTLAGRKPPEHCEWLNAELDHVSSDVDFVFLSMFDHAP